MIVKRKPLPFCHLQNCGARPTPAVHGNRHGMTHPRRRRAGVFVMALGASMIVTVIGLAAVLSVRVSRRAARQCGEFTEARFLAQSAVELGMLDIRSETNWRQLKPNGTWRSNQALGLGYLTLEGRDPIDNILSNDTSGHVVLTGTGAVGNGRFKLAVELQPDGPPGLDCLESAIHTNLLLTVGSTVTSNAPISSNGAATISLGATVNGDVEALGTITLLGTVNGTVTALSVAKENPAATVFDYYIANAVSISIGSLPTSLGVRELANVVLSPASNPYGATSPRGMYLIDCGGVPLRIKRSRILGTLIILDPGLGSQLTSGIHWERYDALLPALMVRGDMQFAWSATLDEGSSPKTNFNPLGTPYQGLSDADSSDTYPSRIKGLIYLSGSLTTSQPASLEGVLIAAGASMSLNQSLNITHDPTLVNAPPPGFESINRPMIPVPGSWRQIVD
jgi:hypothetical protein